MVSQVTSTHACGDTQIWINLGSLLQPETQGDSLVFGKSDSEIASQWILMGMN